MTNSTMKKYFSQCQGFAFLAIISWSTSCYGQVKKDLQRENVKESQTIQAGQPKLKKSQSTGVGNNVHWSIQDKTGNLWFGTTADGIYKYDGKSFSQFTTTNGLPSNMVNCILEDKDGKLWIATDAGACFYDGKTFTRFKISLPHDTPSNKNDVFSITQDKSGKLWFATINGVYIYDGKSLTRFKVTEDASDCYFKMEYILEDKVGNIWLGGRCNAGVFRYDGKSITNLKPNGDNWAWPVLQDKNENIWFSNWKGAYRYDGKSFVTFTKNDGLSSNAVTRIIDDKKGYLWFGGLNEEDDLGFGNSGGISRYDGKIFTRFTTKNGLRNNDIWTILEDKTGNIWIGTRGTILHRFDGKTFTNFSE